MKRESNYGISEDSDGSVDRFNIIERDKIRRRLIERQREERRNNIVIKGVKPIEDLKWIHKFIEDNLHESD